MKIPAPGERLAYGSSGHGDMAHQTNLTKSLGFCPSTSNHSRTEEKKRAERKRVREELEEGGDAEFHEPKG